jgi:hypothetical protein
VKRIATGAAAGAVVLAVGLVTVRQRGTAAERAADPPAPTALPVVIQTDRGEMLVEEEYLPGVVDCELAYWTESPAALEAQAIAARTYLLRAIVAYGEDFRARTTPAFQCWRRPGHARSAEAVRRTAGLVLRHRGDPINANYVAGTPALDERCAPLGPAEAGYPHETWAQMLALWRAGRKFSGPNWTQIFVTYNEGRRGADVVTTAISHSGPPNRGALSQHGAVCLAERRGFDSLSILRFFYGEDVELGP